MGSFGPLGGPACSMGCGRRSTYCQDGVGPVCPICMAGWFNDVQAEALRLALPQSLDRVRLLIVEMLFGDGYEDLCDCGRCLKPWFKQGWVCPTKWNTLRELRRQGRIT